MFYAPVTCLKLYVLPGVCSGWNLRAAAGGDVDAVLVQCDKEGCCLVVTTGGTGPAPRDVTPDATEAVSVPVIISLPSSFR